MIFCHKCRIGLEAAAAAVAVPRLTAGLLFLLLLHDAAAFTTSSNKAHVIVVVVVSCSSHSSEIICIPASSKDSSCTSDHDLPSCLETFAVSSLGFVISWRAFVVVLSSLSLVNVVAVISTLPSRVVAVAVVARA